MQVVPVLLNLLYEISSVRLYLPKDLRPGDARHTVYKSLEETKKRFPDGLPLLDPVEDMNIKDENLKKVSIHCCFALFSIFIFTLVCFLPVSIMNFDWLVGFVF